jgi:hypothetical protein
LRCSIADTGLAFGIHAFALGRADTAACQRFTLLAPSGIVSRLGFMKSTATCIVMSATV